MKRAGTRGRPLFSRRQLVAAAVLCTFALGAGAQVGDAKPLRIIIPASPGGTTDILARQLQEPLGRQLGQTVVIEYKTGASGAMGAQFVKNAPRDGNTLLFAGNSAVSTTLTLKNVGYDVLKDFAPVALVAATPMVLLVHASVPVANVAQLVEYAKARPNALEYASAGRGSLGHLANELFNQTAGLKMVYVPYAGSAPATQALIAGDIKVLLTTPSDTINSFVASGRIKMLAVSSRQRSAMLPSIPTIGEALPGYDVAAWFGLAAPAGTPAETIAKINDAVNKVVQQPAMQEKLRALGMFTQPGPPGSFGETLANDLKVWTRVVQVANILPE